MSAKCQQRIISRDRHHRASAQVYDLAELQQSRRGRMFVFAFIWGERERSPLCRKFEIMEVEYISGIQPFMDERGKPFWPFRGLSAL